MRRTRQPGGRGEVPGQLQIEWSRSVDLGQGAASPLPSPPPPSSPLVQRLPWDFKNTFPQPTQDAIDSGILREEDAEPENVRAIHEEHARELLMVLHDLDAVLDARRLGVDPATGKPARTDAAKDRLQKLFATEPGRLENWWRTLMDSYESAFGPYAADAFGKAVRAWHAGVEVTAERMPAPSLMPPTSVEAPPSKPAAPKVSRHRQRHRVAARLPVPTPVPSAVAAGNFGQEENGKPVRPGAREVRAITEQHADKLIDLLDSLAGAPADSKDALRLQFDAGIAAYAEDFGQHAADQLEAYVRRQAGLDGSRRAR